MIGFEVDRVVVDPSATPSIIVVIQSSYLQQPVDWLAHHHFHPSPVPAHLILSWDSLSLPLPGKAPSLSHPTKIFELSPPLSSA